VFFSDSLKFFVSLYGHKLPVLTMDISSDGALLASGSADKNLKIWGMDFGDCHRSLFAHGDRCSSNLWQFFLVSICVGLLKSSSS
jgi:U3 small nucleolar RNA-associated protein 12